MRVATNRGEVEQTVAEIAAALKMLRTTGSSPSVMYRQILALGSLFYASIQDLHDPEGAEAAAREIASDMTRPDMPN